MKKIFAIAAMGLTVMSAHAQFYGEATYGNVDLKATDGVDTIESKPAIFSLTLGYDAHPNLGVEGIFAFDGGKDGITLNGGATNANAKVNNSYGLFVKPKFMVSDNFELFGRLGLARSKVTLSAGGLTASGSETEMAYGVGGNYYFSKKAYATVNYMKFYDKDGVKAEGFNFGLGYKF